MAQLASALQQAELQQQEFIEHQPMAAGLQLLLVAGLVDLKQGLGPGNQVLSLAKRLWQRIAPAPDLGQHRGQGLAQPLRPQALREPIHRNQAANALGANLGMGVVEHLHQGVLEGRAVGSFLHKPANSHGGTRREVGLLALEPARRRKALARKKTTHPDLAGDVGQVQFENREVGIAGAGEGVAAPNRGHDRGGAAGLQPADADQIGVIEVITGVVVHQVTQHKQPQLRQSGSRFRAHTLDL